MKRTVFVTMTICLFSLLAIGSVFADTNGVWQYAKDIRPGTFASDEGGGNFTFPEGVTIGGDLSVEDELFLRGMVIDSYFINYDEPNVISNQMIVPGTIQNNRIAPNTIDNSRIAPQTIQNSRIARNTIDSNTIQSGAVRSQEIADNTVGSKDVNRNQVQVRVDQSCPRGYAIRVIRANGRVSCERDTDTVASGRCPKNTYMVGIRNGGPICKSVKCTWRGNTYVSGEKWKQKKSCKYNCGKYTCNGKKKRILQCNMGNIGVKRGWGSCN